MKRIVRKFSNWLVGGFPYFIFGSMGAYILAALREKFPPVMPPYQVITDALHLAAYWSYMVLSAVGMVGFFIYASRKLRGKPVSFWGMPNTKEIDK